MSERIKYSEFEIAMLFNLYPDLDALQKRLRHRSRGSLVHKAGKLGLTKKAQPEWTSQEDELLREHHPNYAAAALALPRRSTNALIGRACFLGLGRAKRAWRAEQRNDRVCLIKETPRGEIVVSVGRPLALPRKGSQISLDGPSANVKVVEDIRRNCNARGIVLGRSTAGTRRRQRQERSLSVFPFSQAN